MLVQADSSVLKQLGLVDKQDREKLKERIKELRKQNDHYKGMMLEAVADRLAEAR